MHRVPRRRLLAAILASLTLVAIAVPPIAGVASAAQTPTTCPTDEGTHCELVISMAQSVLTGAPFPVQVLVTTDGTTVAKGDPCASTVLVHIDVLQSNGEGGWDYDPIISTDANAVAGVATFNPTVIEDDLYRVDASTQLGDSESLCDSYDYSTDSQEFNSVTIPPTQPIAPCPDNVECVQAASGTGSGATLIGDDGTSFHPLGASYFSSLADWGTGACGSWAPADPAGGVLGFTHTGGGLKTIIFALSSNLVTAGIGQFNVCWEQGTPFKQLGGTISPADLNTYCGASGLPGSGTCYRGLLPDCTKDKVTKEFVPPCVLFKKSNQRNVGFFGVLASDLDPKGSPGHI